MLDFVYYSLMVGGFLGAFRSRQDGSSGPLHVYRAMMSPLTADFPARCASRPSTVASHVLPTAWRQPNFVGPSHTHLDKCFLLSRSTPKATVAPYVLCCLPSSSSGPHPNISAPSPCIPTPSPRTLHTTFPPTQLPSAALTPRASPFGTRIHTSLPSIFNISIGIAAPVRPR